jgi:putative membrane protein insertion efficiency factor
MKKLISFLITIYQEIFSSFLRIFFGKGCRFSPSCSEYTKEAIERFGVIRGSFLSIKRLLHCHPWGGYGWDPVPRKAKLK